MTVTEAKELIHYEYESDDGLDLLFRMSADIEKERIAKFITALKCLEEHYATQQMIEKELVYKIYSMHQTLQASMKYWIASRPKGLDRHTCSEISARVSGIFTP